MKQQSNRRVLAFVLVAALAAAALGAGVPGAAANPPAPTAQPAQRVTVTNTPLPVEGAVTVANTDPLTVQATDTEVIIDEYKDLDFDYHESIYTFGTHDLSAYKSIRIMVVGDCVFEAPYNCAQSTHKVHLEMRALMGHPNTPHDTDHPNWQYWRPFYWLENVPVGTIGTDTVDLPGGVVEFRVHYPRGPVHLVVLGSRS